MPARPKSICKHPGCGKLIDAPGFCDGHAKQRQREADSRRRVDDARRGTAKERGYTYKWRQARASFLSANPLCLECEKAGRLTPATVVDHVEPHKGDMAKFWSQRNWQPLCASCHSIKTAREDGGFGNAVRSV